MPTTFRPYQPDQGLLLPSDLRDWLPAGHLARHVPPLGSRTAGPGTAQSAQPPALRHARARRHRPEPSL